MTSDQVLDLVKYFKVHWFPRGNTWVAMVMDCKWSRKTIGRASNVVPEKAVVAAVVQALPKLGFQRTWR